MGDNLALAEYDGTKARIWSISEFPENGFHSCQCDFCTGKKSWNDNWCARCGECRLVLPKWWENMDVCLECEEQMRQESWEMTPVQEI